MTPERVVLLGELLVGVAAGLAFIAGCLLGPWRRSPVSRQLMVMAIASTGELATLAAVLAGWRPPWLLLIAGYAAVDVVMVRWVWLLWRARHDRTGDHG